MRLKCGDNNLKLKTKTIYSMYLQYLMGLNGPAPGCAAVGGVLQWAVYTTRLA